MPTAENAKLEYESGQNSTAMSELTDSGDATNYTSAASLFSQRSGFSPVVRPDGVASGGVVIPAVAAGDDNVDVAALTLYLAGVLVSVSAGLDESITRPATAVSKINSIQITSAGAIAIIAGTDGTDTNFVETRGAAGGPPFVIVGSIEVAQVRVITNTTGVIAASEIFQVVDLHQERYDSPLFETDHAAGEVNFLSAIPLFHTADAPKGVYASYASPIFAEVSLASDYVPSETSHAVSSEQVYGSIIGSNSQSLNQGTFTAKLNDGVTDPIVRLKNENLWFRFYPDKYKAPFILDQGFLGVSRAFPAGSSLQAACTISATSAAIEKES